MSEPLPVRGWSCSYGLVALELGDWFHSTLLKLLPARYRPCVILGWAGPIGSGTMQPVCTRMHVYQAGGRGHEKSSQSAPLYYRFIEESV